jgi:hypothetical protein
MTRASSNTVTPAASAFDANVSRMSYGVAGVSTPEASMAGDHSRLRKLSRLSGPPAALADGAAGRAGTLPARRAGRRRHRRGRVSPGRRELGEADGELGLDQPLQLAVERRLDQLLHLAVALLEHGVHDAGDALLERRGHKGESTTPPAVLP